MDISKLNITVHVLAKNILFSEYLNNGVLRLCNFRTTSLVQRYLEPQNDGIFAALKSAIVWISSVSEMFYITK